MANKDLKTKIIKKILAGNRTKDEIKAGLDIHANRLALYLRELVKAGAIQEDDDPNYYRPRKIYYPVPEGVNKSEVEA